MSVLAGVQPAHAQPQASGLSPLVNPSNPTQPIVKVSDLSNDVLDDAPAEIPPGFAKLQNRVDAIETQATRLETQQFSPVTKLEGEAIFAIGGVVGGKTTNNPDLPVESQVFLGNRLRLNLETSFTGRDRLRLRLQARNIPELEEVTGTQMANLSFDGADGNRLEISDLEYQFPIRQQTRVYVNAEGAGLRDYVGSVNPYFGSSGRGSISTFGRENPVTRQGGGAGFGISHDFNDAFNLGVGYVANNAGNPEEGLFGDRYGAIAQLTIKPTDSSAVGLTYVRSFNNFDTGTGSELTSDPFNNQSKSVQANSFSAEAAVEVAPNVNLGGRIGLIQATATDIDGSPTADIFTWSVQVALPDVGREDSLLGVIIGQPPKVIKNQLGTNFTDEDTSLHLEAFYRFQLTDNIGITPGIVAILNPDHNNGNDSIVVGTIRTTIRF